MGDVATAVRERPILFTGAMVRALLAGTKTQTRRLVKPQPMWELRRGLRSEGWAWERGRTSMSGWHEDGDFSRAMAKHCPYGTAGDRLWVKESYWGCDMPGHGDIPCIVYDEEHCGHDYQPLAVRPWALKFGRVPSIHCARIASRISLEITDLRVERLQDISESDAYAEGVDGGCVNCGKPSRDGGCGCPDPCPLPRDSYLRLWEEINGAGSWDANPWVWAIGFKRVTP